MKNVTENIIDPVCAAAHVSPWLADTTWINGMLGMYRSGALQAKAVADGTGRLLYAVDDQGIATVGLSGALMRGESKYGGTSTLRARRAVRAAKADDDVRGMMLSIDSPGGTVAGTDELAGDLRAFARKKTLHAHAEGVMASAGYALGIQADRLTATRLTQVGSIGVVSVLYDESERMDKEGIKVHVFKTGDHKGAFTPGAEVTEAHMEYAQSIVDDTMKWFRSEVVTRRGMDAEAFDKVSSGRTWHATEASSLGLIDRVGTIDAAYSSLRIAIENREVMERDRKKLSASLR